MARITIEIAGPQNDNYMWPVTQEALRGRWRAAVVAHHDKSDGLKAVCALESIPGLHVWIDTRAKECGICDPLGMDEKGEPVSDEGRRKFKQWETIQREHQTQLSKMAPWEPQAFSSDRCNKDFMKEWLFCMRRAIDAGYAIYVDGSQQLPPIEEIVKLPGRITNEPFNSGTKGNDIPRFRFGVEVPA